MDFNHSISISLALRKIVVLLCHHMIISNSQKLGHLFLVMYGTSLVQCECKPTKNDILIALCFFHFLGPIHSLNVNPQMSYFFFFFSFTLWNFGAHTSIDFQIRSNCFLCNLTYRLKKKKKRKTENLPSEIALLFRKEKLNNKSKDDLFHN